MSMEVEAAVPMTSFVPQARTATILCCNCGAPIDGTSTDTIDALCHDCIKLTLDISGGIQREGHLHTCRDCDRWLSPPAQWVTAAPESRELLALCLRKLKGLAKVRIVDASFVWTEPHSRRIKVKVTVQQEASVSAILQQTFECEFVVSNAQCSDCAKSYTHNTWRANVQVRQKVPHKRTFLYLEQLILKYNAHKDTINIKENYSGIDFYFGQRNSAEKFVEFLTSVVPCRTKTSKELISMDVHTSSTSYKFTFSVELLPICKDDLVALPLKMAQAIGGITPMVLCYRIGTSLNVLDPHTLQTADISSPVYWRAPFAGLADVRELIEFIVMDIEPLGPTKGRFLLAEATVRRAADLGVNDTEYTVRTHLGAVLHPGDSVMGYHLALTQFNSPELEAIERSKTFRGQIPDVVLVKKVYPRSKKANHGKGRNWKLRRMAREEGEMAPRKQDAAREEADYEMFLRDVEEDPELRNTIHLYKAQERQQQQQQQQRERETRAAAGADDDMDVEDEQSVVGDPDEDGDDDDDGDELEIDLSELRDEFEGMSMAGGQ